jgi:hypothetical protein
MSKVSAMQAMREARYSARPATRPAVPPSATAAAPAARTAAETSALPDAVGQPVVPSASSTPAVALEPDLALLPAEVLTAAAIDRPNSDLAEEAPEALCGHRSMNNRNCRRPAGHPEKNHRYN